ncbi:hypothetical protein D3C80_1571930 [compost metagenome]
MALMATSLLTLLPRCWSNTVKSVTIICGKLQSGKGCKRLQPLQATAFILNWLLILALLMMWTAFWKMAVKV